jgi:hypothetical protein
MISSNLIFSKAAALRILHFATKIEAIRVFKGAIQVTYWTRNGRCSTFLSKSAFFRDFVAFRYEGAKSVTVRQWRAGSYQNHYECHSENSARIRTVKLLAGTVMCDCEDYFKQEEELGRAAIGCKHLIAVLHQLGYASLEKYLEAKEVETAKILVEADAARESIFAF